MSALATAAPIAAIPIRATWDRLMAAFAAAKAAEAAIYARYDAAMVAYEADRPAEPEIDMTLLFCTRLVGFSITSLLYREDLDELQRRILAAKGVTRWERVDRDHQRIAELDKVREFRRLIAEANERHGIAALDDEWSASGGELARARNALLLAPAPHYDAVRWKLDQLFGPDATYPAGDEGRVIPCWDAELTDAVIADMARLGGAA